MRRAYLGIGSNMGDRAANLGFAIRELARLGVVRARSPIIETLPVDCPGGGPFLNACVRLDVESTPRALLASTQRIEQARGRQRRLRNEPRVLDIDLLLIDDLVIRGPGFVLPHPRMHLREFVLEPLAAIAPRLAHPLLKADIRELRAALARAETIRPGTVGTPA